jgi:hypothetical protein
MNCWEAVLYSAFEAKLVDKSWLQTIHRKAALAYQFNHRLGSNGEEHYFKALSYALGYYSGSFPYRPAGGLIPCEGDVLFFGCDDHVAVSLGRDTSCNPHDWMMSLGTHNDGTFSLLSLKTLPQLVQESVRFVPCPF